MFAGWISVGYVIVGRCVAFCCVANSLGAEWCSICWRENSATLSDRREI